MTLGEAGRGVPQGGVPIHVSMIPGRFGEMSNRDQRMAASRKNENARLDVGEAFASGERDERSFNGGYPAAWRALDILFYDATFF
jgi:hypothetical protein